jgi:hypothetical protein
LLKWQALIVFDRIIKVITELLMKRLPKIQFLFVTLFWILMASGTMYAQFSIPSKINKKGGWELPNLNEFEKTHQREVSIENFLVTTSVFKPKKTIDVNLEEYTWKDDDKTLFISARECYVYDVTAYAVKDKTFAYQIGYVRYHITENVKLPTRGVIPVFYIDKNGDGKFETRDMLIEMPELPNWVKKVSQ